MSADASVLVYGLGGLALFVLGCHAVFFGGEPLRRILALNVLGSGVFLVLVAAASRGGEAGIDPVPHAMVLTGLVVSVSATALALILLLSAPAPGRSRAVDDP